MKFKIMRALLKRKILIGPHIHQTCPTFTPSHNPLCKSFIFWFLISRPYTYTHIYTHFSHTHSLKTSLFFQLILVLWNFRNLYGGLGHYESSIPCLRYISITFVFWLGFYMTFMYLYELFFFFFGPACQFYSGCWQIIFKTPSLSASIIYEI